MKACEGCKKEFEPKSKKARFCSSKCRKDAFMGKRTSQTIVPEKRIVPGIVPNWRKKGLSSQEQAIEAIIAKLKEDSAKIHKHSLEKEVKVYWGDKKILI